MKITPLEIRQKDFEKKLRGYDKDEVSAFLQSLSNEWERVLEENKELNLKLKQAEKEVTKLREVESSLYKTLKTAEDTGANVIDQANKAAELHMKETKMNAEALLNESKNKARAMMEQAEMEARQIIEELQDAVKSIEQNHRDIEHHRQMAIQELKNLSIALIEKVEKNTQETKEFRFDDYVKRVKKLARESEERIKAEKTVVSIESKSIDVSTPELKEIEEHEKDASLKIEKAKSSGFTEQIHSKPAEKSEEKTEDISQNDTKSEEKIVEVKQTTSTSNPKNDKMGEEVQEERKGPRIAKTVSFFDQLDTDN